MATGKVFNTIYICYFILNIFLYIYKICNLYRYKHTIDITVLEDYLSITVQIMANRLS